MNTINREQWLNQAISELGKTVFSGKVIPPAIRVSCGFPSRGGTSAKSKRIGECWSPAASAAGNHEIFISPVLADPLRVLDVLCHEMVHAIVGVEAGHKGPFKRLAKAIGLEGKMTATIAGPALIDRLNDLINQIVPYPHAQLMPSNGKKKDGTRMLKLTCPACGYVIRTTAKWIETGIPTCACGEMFSE